uniref:Uncharacterized protein n=1 Tax=Strigamia maritima TaxID=126957 RepID=T1IKS8_STRMM
MTNYVGILMRGSRVTWVQNCLIIYIFNPEFNFVLDETFTPASTNRAQSTAHCKFMRSWISFGPDNGLFTRIWIISRSAYQWIPSKREKEQRGDSHATHRVVCATLDHDWSLVTRCRIHKRRSRSVCGLCGRRRRFHHHRHARRHGNFAPRNSSDS